MAVTTSARDRATGSVTVRDRLRDRDVNGMLAIVADDLTGANDSAVQFADAGWSVFLLLETAAPGELLKLGEVADRPEPGKSGEHPVVIAITSDARALPHGAAADASAAGATRVIACGASRLFIKVDSTMRGSVAAQIDGAMAAWRARHPRSFAVVCPAYPRMGRTVEGGIARVHGGLLEDSPAGRDPVTPLGTSELGRLLPGSVHVALPSGPDAATRITKLAAALTAAAASAESATPTELAAPTESAARVPVLTVDASTDEEIALIANAIVALDGRAVPVGSAGLAHAMADLARPARAVRPVRAVEAMREAQGGAASNAGLSNGAVLAAGSTPETPETPAPLRVAVVVSSLHAAARAQADNLVTSATSATGAAPTRWFPSRGDLADRSRATDWARTASVQPVGDLALLASPSPSAAAGDDTQPGGEAAIVADGLATVACLLIERQRSSVLVLVGGDGARAVLARAGTTAVRVLGQLSEGVPWGLIVGGQFDGMRVVTKAGGFGAADALTDIVRRLRSAADAPIQP